MADERLRVVVDEPYLAALGRCLFVFAQLEWMAVWCGEKIAPGFLSSAKGKTAGSIAADLEALVQTSLTGATLARTLAAAQDFRRLVKTRNHIMHAQTCHTAAGTERLMRDGNEWSISELEDAADGFARCSIELNDLFYNVLP